MFAKDSKGGSDALEFIVEKILILIPDAKKKVAARTGKGGEKYPDTAEDSSADSRQSMIKQH